MLLIIIFLPTLDVFTQVMSISEVLFLNAFVFFGSDLTPELRTSYHVPLG